MAKFFYKVPPSETLLKFESLETWKETPCVLAEVAAENYFERTDFDQSEWPLTIEIYDHDKKSFGQYKISLDFDPCFLATKVVTD